MPSSDATRAEKLCELWAASTDSKRWGDVDWSSIGIEILDDLENGAERGRLLAKH